MHIIHVGCAEWIRLPDEDIPSSWVYTCTTISSSRGFGCLQSHMDDKALKWSLVLCLPARARQLKINMKGELAPPHWLPSRENPPWTMEPPQLVSIFVSVSQDPIKHTWALLTVMPQPVPYYIVSMYSVRPSLKFNYVFPETKAYTSHLQSCLPSDWPQQCSAHLPNQPLRKALLSLHNTHSVLDVSCTWEPPFCTGDQYQS